MIRSLGNKIEPYIEFYLAKHPIPSIYKALGIYSPQTPYPLSHNPKHLGKHLFGYKEHKKHLFYRLQVAYLVSQSFDVDIYYFSFQSCGFKFKDFRDMNIAIMLLANFGYKNDLLIHVEDTRLLIKKNRDIKWVDYDFNLNEFRDFYGWLKDYE